MVLAAWQQSACVGPPMNVSVTRSCHLRAASSHLTTGLVRIAKGEGISLSGTVTAGSSGRRGARARSAQALGVADLLDFALQTVKARE
jgi:hypothetical protein